MMYTITMIEYDSEIRKALSAYNSKIRNPIALALIVLLPIVLVLAFIWV